METDSQILDFLYKHLASIFENDIETYHKTTSEELTLYEWWVTPNRIDGLPFHDFMLEQNAKAGTVFGSEKDPDAVAEMRFDLANLKIQAFDNSAVASYTLLISSSLKSGVQTSSHNESRVLVKIEDAWKVVHVHKSPAWRAPHLDPGVFAGDS